MHHAPLYTLLATNRRIRAAREYESPPVTRAVLVSSIHRFGSCIERHLPLTGSRDHSKGFQITNVCHNAHNALIMGVSPGEHTDLSLTRGTAINRAVSMTCSLRLILLNRLAARPEHQCRWGSER